jgi:8-oxo-(d)GTP phosphatase
MILFINDRPVKFVEKRDYLENVDDYSQQKNIIDASKEAFSPIHLFGNLIVHHASLAYIRSFYNYVNFNKRTHFESIIFIVVNRKKAKNLTKSFYSIVKAAGGVIKNDNNELLMIHRLGKWDLPKGKMDKGESAKQTAVREVEEECNIKVKLLTKAATTWHTYTHKGKNVLKKTNWYHMKNLDDSKMTPQQEEDIDDIQWMDSAKVEAASLNTYLSIIFVIKKSSLLNSRTLEIF